MSNETERIINRSNAEHLHRLKMKELGGKIVKKRADELLENFNLSDREESKFKAKRFLKSLLNKAHLKHEVDPDKYIYPYILLPNPDDAFLVLEKKLISRKRPHNESTKGLSWDCYYTKLIALGYRKVEDGLEVGFFGKNKNDPDIFEDPDRGIFLSLDAGMLFTKTVTEEEIVPTLALAIASYEYNKGRPLNDQVTFPSEI
ncbi:MAG: hypothetical protein PHR98_01370 [Candidatus Shapirobacteria bacterium]|jgi:hypothetical protein|nr:hypothetical protein [Candidatus Shapirobacteria bacterium]